VILADYAAFFQAADVTVFPLTAVCERAARIRATYKIKPLDALHLATAIEHGCGLFLTKDARLQRCTQITVETLT
jgi:predicted nucleic acid-binding protein